jgi:hypothetical protein
VDGPVKPGHDDGIAGSAADQISDFLSGISCLSLCNGMGGGRAEMFRTGYVEARSDKWRAAGISRENRGCQRGRAGMTGLVSI